MKGGGLFDFSGGLQKCSISFGLKLKLPPPCAECELNKETSAIIFIWLYKGKQHGQLYLLLVGLIHFISPAFVLFFQKCEVIYFS